MDPSISRNNKPRWEKELKVSDYIQIASESEVGLDASDYEGAVVYNKSGTVMKYSNGTEWIDLLAGDPQYSTFVADTKNDL